MVVYLAGPMFNVSRSESKSWRGEAKHFLSPYKIDTSDPHDRSYTPGKEVELVNGDLEAIRKSDAVIAHVPTDVPMAGTPMEIFYAAYVLRIPVYTFPINRSPWIIRWSTKSFETLQELTNFIADDNNV